MTANENEREPGYYWVMLNGEWYIGKWYEDLNTSGRFNYREFVWKIHNDKHSYNDLELDAILPTRLTIDKYERMYGQQLAYFNDKQKEFLFGEQPGEPPPLFTLDEVAELIRSLKSKKHGKDARHP
jgi:hypothetical protein